MESYSTLVSLVIAISGVNLFVTLKIAFSMGEYKNKIENNIKAIDEIKKVLSNA